MQRTYPPGVPCWIDLEVPDVAQVDAAARFYGELLGWTFEDRLPPGAPARYLIGQLAGQDAGGLGTASYDLGGAAVWSTYIAVDDVDARTRQLADAGATIELEPEDAGPGGRLAALRDPAGATFRLWQARARLGSQVVNVPGAWNFSDLRLADPADLDWYVDAFGWLTAPQEPWQTMLRVPGYGDHLEATVDPDIRRRQEFAPDGFEDVIGGALRTRAGEPSHWHVTFAVADRDRAAAAAERLGATVTGSAENDWTRTADVRDPWGAVLTLSELTAG